MEPLMNVRAINAFDTTYQTAQSTTQKDQFELTVDQVSVNSFHDGNKSNLIPKTVTRFNSNARSRTVEPIRKRPKKVLQQKMNEYYQNTLE